MDFGWSTEELAFRDRVRDFIHSNWNGSDPEEGDGDETAAWERTREYQKEMAKHGWLTMAWPREYGGQAASFMEQMIGNFSSEQGERFTRMLEDEARVTTDPGAGHCL